VQTTSCIICIYEDGRAVYDDDYSVSHVLVNDDANSDLLVVHRLLERSLACSASDEIHGEVVVYNFLTPTARVLMMVAHKSFEAQCEEVRRRRAGASGREARREGADGSSSEGLKKHHFPIHRLFEHLLHNSTKSTTI
jgi:hypothetical protein